MKKVKFLFIFNKENYKKDCFWGKSLRKGVQYFLCISYLYLILFFFLGIFLQENLLFTSIKILVYSLLDFLNLHFFLKSTNSFSFKQAKFGLDLLNFSIIWHIILFTLKTILFLMTFHKFSFLDFKTKTIEDHSEIYELFYLCVQFGFYNILFSYTMQLSEGNDALVDGQEFNRYVENFELRDSDSRRSNSNSENRINNVRENQGNDQMENFENREYSFNDSDNIS